MNKTIVVAGVLFVALVLVFGCTQVDYNGGTDNNVKVNSDAQAAKTLNDVSTDIAGINNSLGEIDAALTDTNAA